MIATNDLHPLDFSKLEKGDVIPQELIERAYLINRDVNYDRFRFAQMDLVEQIETRRTDLWPRSQGASVLVMTDAEAEEYCKKRVHDLVRALARTTGRRFRINRETFSPEARAEAESRDRTYSGLALLTGKELRKAESMARLVGKEAEKI